MKKRYLRFISVLTALFSISLAISIIIEDRLALNDKEKYLYPLILVIGTVIIIISEIIIFSRIEHNNKYLFDKSIVQLDKLIKYNKQRAEIEEEIRMLTRQLEYSNVAQYVDINRLAFSGQNDNLISNSINSINYENFLLQFGIDQNSIVIKEGTAAFLTPFDKQGMSLFEKCQSILGNIDIFLRKTDNVVEKDDILMNIVLLIIQSEFILVNIDGRNPNVYYELGIAHALGKPTILLSKAKYTLDDIGFDIRQKRIVIYQTTEELERELLSQISMLKRKHI